MRSLVPQNYTLRSCVNRRRNADWVLRIEDGVGVGETTNQNNNKNPTLSRPKTQKFGQIRDML